MIQFEQGLRQCPTREDGTEVLVAHSIRRSECQKRQRGHYHKCYVCAYNNARSAGLAATAAPPPASELREVLPVAPNVSLP